MSFRPIHRAAKHRPDVIPENPISLLVHSIPSLRVVFAELLPYFVQVFGWKEPFLGRSMPALLLRVFHHAALLSVLWGASCLCCGSWAVPVVVLAHYSYTNMLPYTM